MSKEMMSKITKENVSVSEMAQMLDMSRARFYQLMEQGIFPKPFYFLKNQRPFYDRMMQQYCLTIRETGQGWNNEPILFYRSRTKKSSSKKKSNQHSYQEIFEALQSMGLQCTVKEVSNSIDKNYPKGIENEDQGVVIREIYRFLKSKS